MRLDEDVTLVDFIEANKDYFIHVNNAYHNIKLHGALIPVYKFLTKNANEYKLKKKFTDKLDSIIQE